MLQTHELRPILAQAWRLYFPQEYDIEIETLAQEDDRCDMVQTFYEFFNESRAGQKMLNQVGVHACTVRDRSENSLA